LVEFGLNLRQINDEMQTILCPSLHVRTSRIWMTDDDKPLPTVARVPVRLFEIKGNRRQKYSSTANDSWSVGKRKNKIRAKMQISYGNWALMSQQIMPSLGTFGALFSTCLLPRPASQQPRSTNENIVTSTLVSFFLVLANLL
jgi:hypothetical protein